MDNGISRSSIVRKATRLIFLDFAWGRGNATNLEKLAWALEGVLSSL